MVKHILVSIHFLLALACVGQTSQQRPNVIVIYSDDQGYADLNCYGSKDLMTPHLDCLAREGVRFTNFYAAAPICSPSRASLLTGRYPQRAGLTGNAGGRFGNTGMPAAQWTMAELFRSAGYATAHIGKWHLGFTEQTQPNAQGFDYSFGFMGGCIDNYSHYYYWGGPNEHDLWRQGKEIWEPGKLFSDLMVEEATRFLSEHRAKPFFLYFAINNPHYPLQGEPKWFAHYKNLKAPRKMYAASVSYMDEKIGLLLAAIDRLGLKENTIVVFQADQGFSREERGFGGGGSSGQLRGAKFSIFEGGVKVPAMIRWPGKIEKKGIRTQFCSNIDWLPTLAAYCQIPLPDIKIDGKSFVDIIRHPRAPAHHESFFWQCLGTKENPQWAVREGHWKLLHHPIESDRQELDADGFMLVNMAADSTEHRNEIARYPEIAKRLKDKYETWIKEVVNQD